MDYNFRMYSPYLNHFTQPDSIVPDPYNPQDWNRYSYVRNNPIRYNDPSGHCYTDSGTWISGGGDGDCGFATSTPASDGSGGGGGGSPCSTYSDVCNNGGSGNPGDKLKTDAGGKCPGLCVLDKTIQNNTPSPCAALGYPYLCESKTFTSYEVSQLVNALTKAGEQWGYVTAGLLVAGGVLALIGVLTVSTPLVVIGSVLVIIGAITGLNAGLINTAATNISTNSGKGPTTEIAISPGWPTSIAIQGTFNDSKGKTFTSTFPFSTYSSTVSNILQESIPINSPSFIESLQDLGKYFVPINAGP
jgi:hypothetical protein